MLIRRLSRNMYVQITMLHTVWSEYYKGLASGHCMLAADELMESSEWKLDAGHVCIEHTCLD
jgi:hypothetical protein